MAQYTSNTLKDLIGAIRQVSRNCPPVRCRDVINQRLRDVMDYRPFWSGTLKSGVLSVPASYATGTISLSAGSNVVSGSSTAWPVSDGVNTTIAAAITEPGTQVVIPGSMTGITEDTYLVVDSGASEELVSVVEVGSASFRATFAKAHNAGVAIKASSLAGRQLRLGGSYPTYTVTAVRSATELLLDMPWAGPSLSDTSYSIVKMFFTFAHDVKDILWVFDPVQGCELDIHYPQDVLNADDPRRECGGDPRLISDLRPSEMGNMQYELYPPQTGARQLPFLYVRQWPELRKDSDRLPPFLNPNLVIYGGLSLALRTKHEKDDSFYDPIAANTYEQMYRKALEDAAAADDSKAQQTLTYEKGRWSGGPRGANWAQSHDVSIGGNQWW